MVITSAVGALLILVGIVLFVVDLHVIGHGLLTAGGIVTLLAGGLLLLWAGVPYSGVLLGALAVVAVLMGGVLLGVLGSLRALGRRPALTGKEGMIGRSAPSGAPWGELRGMGVRSRGAVAGPASVRPRETDPQDREPVVGAGRKVRVVGFGEGGLVQVVPIEPPGGGRDLDRVGR